MFRVCMCRSIVCPICECSSVLGVGLILLCVEWGTFGRFFSVNLSSKGSNCSFFPKAEFNSNLELVGKKKPITPLGEHTTDTANTYTKEEEQAAIRGNRMIQFIIGRYDDHNDEIKRIFCVTFLHKKLWSKFAIQEISKVRQYLGYIYHGCFNFVMFVVPVGVLRSNSGERASQVATDSIRFEDDRIPKRDQFILSRTYVYFLCHLYSLVVIRY